MNTKIIAVAALALTTLTGVASASGFDPAYTSRDREVLAQSQLDAPAASIAVRPINPAFDPALDQRDRQLLAQQGAYADTTGAIATNDDVNVSVQGSGFDPASDSRDRELRALELRAWGK